VAASDLSSAIVPGFMSEGWSVWPKKTLPVHPNTSNMNSGRVFEWQVKKRGQVEDHCYDLGLIRKLKSSDIKILSEIFPLK
jgi:hypothetical protein